MKDILDGPLTLISVVFWLAGVALSKGFWGTAAAVCLPPWAWYLVVERAMMAAGWL